MATMEGPLSKWTNVMKGWQYRWFVLTPSTGLLSYYTSKEKMMKGSRRGCVVLKGALIGVDDEDDSTFTITADQKTFHFQARDSEEREKWIEALENAIMRFSHITIPKKVDGKSVPIDLDFDRKLAESDSYLQLMLEQVNNLEIKIDNCDDIASREKYNVIKVTAITMIESIKHAIVMLQISKESLKGPVMNGSIHESLPPTPSQSMKSSSSFSLSMNGVEQGVDAVNVPIFNHATEELNTVQNERSRVERSAVATVPENSYSSSEDEDFFDAEETSPRFTPEKTPPQSLGNPGLETNNKTAVSRVISSEGDYFDPLYDDMEDEDLGSVEKHGSIIYHLLSQVRIGMDLTKVVLPTFILERRSLLEMFADFFAHADYFVEIADKETPHDRMVQVVKWYLSAFHAGRNSEIAKKPYNPILGETYQCYWNVPGMNKCKELSEDGPISWASRDNLVFIAEQVSHHPPISAFYAEHFNKRISLDGYIWTKSKFLGLSIGVHMIGQAVLSLIDRDEEYILTFPNGYGRSILTVPWIELGGKVTVNCPTTGYSATVDFLTKPFYGSRKHRIQAEIFPPMEKKPFCTIEGEWNGVMYTKYATGMNEVFLDTKKIPTVHKQVKPIESQLPYESRRLWRDVTYNLKMKNVDVATEHKHKLEQIQRDEAKERKEKGLKWETRHFHEVGEHWVYDRPLLKRLGKATSSPPDTL